MFLSLLAGLAFGFQTSSSWEKEVVYQVFPRSFADSNGDRVGDFKGIQNHLGYIKGLGATAILLQPILKSRLYHNYFPDSFLETDPKFGTNNEFFDLVHAAHRAGMKVILDMEEQFVASDHPWFSDPTRITGGGALGFREIPSYDGSRVPVSAVNTNNPTVVKGIRESFVYWANPPGRASDGVDGFRLDHMMDDLDNKHKNTDMYARFWIPLESAVRAKKPHSFFVAEQSDWGLGKTQFQQADVDATYAIPLRFVFLKALIGAPPKEKPYQTGELAKAYREEQEATPAGRTQLIFVENHDLERYASEVGSDPALLRLGAVFMLTAKGTPSIYYGQELGMKGVQVHGHTDGNDIPDRLAMPWNNRLDAPGIATWYGAGPWTEPGYSKDGDGISVEAEDQDPQSLLNFYRKLIHLRRTNSALSSGSEDYSRVTDTLIDVTRQSRTQRVRILINLSATPDVILDTTRHRDLWTGAFLRGTIDVAAYGFRIIQLDGD